MESTQVLISSPIGVLAVLCIVAAFFFLLAQVSKAKLFNYVPPLLFIYATPVFLSNLTVAGHVVLPNESVIYSGLSKFVLPVFIVLMLIKVNVPAVVKVMGKGVLVMLMGTLGVMVGGVVAYVLVHGWLPDDSWKGFGTLAGSWIGGTANMLATKEMLGASEAQLGLAVVADNIIYIVWLPLLLMSRDFADKFNKWARVPADRLEAMDAAAALHVEEDHAPSMQQYLYLAAVVFGVAAIGHSARNEEQILDCGTRGSQPGRRPRSEGGVNQVVLSAKIRDDLIRNANSSRHGEDRIGRITPDFPRDTAKRRARFDA